MFNLNELLKSQPIVILILMVLMLAILTPVVFLFAQQQTNRELLAREQDAYVRAAEIDKRAYESTYQAKRIEDEVSALRRDMRQMKSDLDIALKTIVGFQKEITDLKSNVNSRKQ
jgi:hypothetical protein